MLSKRYVVFLKKQKKNLKMQERIFIAGDRIGIVSSPVLLSQERIVSLDI